jgi:hypothetical protein
MPLITFWSNVSGASASMLKNKIFTPFLQIFFINKVQWQNFVQFKNI